MAKFLVRANYIGEGIQGLLKDGGSGRQKAVEKLAASVGGKLESMYYAFGEHDLYAIMDMPDNISMASLSLKVNAAGLVAVNCVVLMTPEEIDEAVKKKSEYRGPGK